MAAGSVWAARPSFVGRPFIGRPFVGRRVFFGRPFRRRVFFGGPFYGAGFYGGYYGSCWRWRFTPWGWRRIWVCGYGGYGYPYSYW